MNIKNIFIAIIILSAGTAIGYYIGFDIGFEKSVRKEKEQNTAVSPYVGQESRAIKSLSNDDIELLQEGSGVVFGGMAKPAELNGYPGPKHILELADELELTSSQRKSISVLFNEMQTEAIRLGSELVDIEKEIDKQFVNKIVSKTSLQELLKDSAFLYGELRSTHLQAHLKTIDILSQEQVALYNQLRGYEVGNPCVNVPEGHDPAMWKLHNNCA